MFFCCLLLVLVCLQDFTTDAQYPYEPAPCCYRYQTHPVPGRLITAYEETQMHCTNPGVIFTLKNGRHFCGDPRVKWVKHAMERLEYHLFESPIIRDEHGHQCCSRFWTHPINESEIETYEETHINCTNPGVIFTIKNDHRVCADPGVEWVKQAMERLDQRLFESEHGPEHCCFKFHRNPISVRLITEYKVTHMDCPKPGVIFSLKYDHRVCADRGVEWVKQAMKRLHQQLFDSSIIRDEHGHQCCSRFWTHPINESEIETYEETHINCTNPGVIFTIKNDHRVCADPGVEWVKQAMERFDQCLFESEHGPEHCCFKFHRNPIPVRLITEYKVTHISCPNPGVIFTLKNGRHLCADLRVEWGKWAIKFFNQRLFEKNNYQG